MFILFKIFLLIVGDVNDHIGVYDVFEPHVGQGSSTGRMFILYILLIFPLGLMHVILFFISAIKFKC